MCKPTLAIALAFLVLCGAATASSAPLGFLSKLSPKTKEYVENGLETAKEGLQTYLDKQKTKVKAEIVTGCTRNFNNTINKIGQWLVYLERNNRTVTRAAVRAEVNKAEQKRIRCIVSHLKSKKLLN